MISWNGNEEKFADDFIRNSRLLCEKLEEMIETVRNTGTPVNIPGLVFTFAKNKLLTSTLEGKNELVYSFIDKTYNHWRMLALESSDCFIENISEVFPDLPENYANEIKSLFVLPCISLDDKIFLSRCVKEMCIACIWYVHEMRRFDPNTRKYTAKYATNVKVGDMKSLFDI